jgi:hypothetical protein
VKQIVRKRCSARRIARRTTTWEEEQCEKSSNTRGVAMQEEWQHVRSDIVRKGSVRKAIVQEELREEQHHKNNTRGGMRKE